MTHLEVKKLKNHQYIGYVFIDKLRIYASIGSFEEVAENLKNYGMLQRNTI